MEQLEIERKFLVRSLDYREVAVSKKRIVQGFLNTHPERTVRIRVAGEKAFITVKGIGNSSGTTRFEWEKEIPVAEATNLIDLCEPIVVEKIRYNVLQGDHLFEVDEFLGENKGLIIAEIELKHEDEAFEKPAWLGKEITGNTAYYNSQLSKKPYNQWHD